MQLVGWQATYPARSIQLDVKHSHTDGVTGHNRSGRKSNGWQMHGSSHNGHYKRWWNHGTHRPINWRRWGLSGLATGARQTSQGGWKAGGNRGKTERTAKPQTRTPRPRTRERTKTREAPVGGGGGVGGGEGGGGVGQQQDTPEVEQRCRHRHNAYMQRWPKTKHAKPREKTRPETRTRQHPNNEAW